MKANDGCDTCEKNCVNKDMNAYNYCPNYVEDVNKKKINPAQDFDLPDGFADLFGGIF